jgi:uncharacterized protein
MSELIDNSRHRIETLKRVIRRLHDGESPDALKAEFAELLDQVGATEVAAMENELMAEGMPVEEVQRMCDVHAAVLGDRLGSTMADDAVPGHPVHTFRLENGRLRQLVSDYRRLADALLAERLTGELERQWLALHAELSRVEVHYLRKEYLVFPYLEKAGIVGPPKVMWGKHDETRELLRASSELLDGRADLAAGDFALAFETVVTPLLDQVAGMTDKEDQVLWPMCLAHLTPNDWAAIRDQWDEHGEGLVRPAGVWLPVLAKLPERQVELPPDDAIRLPSGHLSARQLEAVLNTLPFDLTFVDADGRVAYFSEGSERVFARNRAIIGRRVEDCHPPKSVHIVEQVVSDLRSGRRDVAEFWIQLGERFVHIRYFAVRDSSGEFLGVLETTQDIAPLKALAGERRLLDELPDGGAA